MALILFSTYSSGCRKVGPNEPDTPGGTSMLPPATNDPGSAGILAVHAISSIGNVGDFDLEFFVTDTVGNLINDLAPTALSMLGGLDTTFTRISMDASTCPKLGPFSAEVLVDQSNSMRWNDAENFRLVASSAFMHGVSLLGNGNEAQFSSFFDIASGGLRTYGPFTTDPASFDPAIWSLAGNLGPATPLYDAMYYMTDSLVQQAHNDNKVLIVLTDGDDNDSYHSLWEAIDHAKQNNVKVFAVALKTGLMIDSTARRDGDDALFQAAMQTNGAAMHTSDPAKAVPYYKGLSKMLNGGTKSYHAHFRVTLPEGQSVSGQQIRAQLRIAGRNNTSILAPFVVTFN